MTTPTILRPYWAREPIMFLPNRKMRSHFFLPHPAELPKGQAKAITFPFLGLADLGTAQAQYSFDFPFALVALTGVMSRSDGAALPATGGFRVSFTKVHGGAQKRLTFKETTNLNCVGTGQRPLYVRSVDLFDIHDTLVVEVKSLIAPGAGVTARIDVTVVGIRVGGV